MSAGHSAEKDAPDHGTVERQPYVGDSDIIVVKCKHGDYSNVFKGATVERGRKALAEHYAAKHSVIPPAVTDGGVS